MANTNGRKPREVSSTIWGWRLENLEWRHKMEVRVNGSELKTSELETQMRAGFERLDKLITENQETSNKKLDSLLEADKDRILRAQHRDEMLASIERLIKLFAGSSAAVGAIYALGHFLHMW